MRSRSTSGIALTIRHTSRVIDAPEPPAIEETTIVTAPVVGSGTSPNPGTAAAVRRACSRERSLFIASMARRMPGPICVALERVSMRPIARDWPAPTEIGKVTSEGSRGIQLAVERRPSVPCAWSFCVTAASTGA